MVFFKKIYLLLEHDQTSVDKIAKINTNTTVTNKNIQDNSDREIRKNYLAAALRPINLMDSQLETSQKTSMMGKKTLSNQMHEYLASGIFSHCHKY